MTCQREYLDHRPRYVLRTGAGNATELIDYMKRPFAGRLQSGNATQADQDRGSLLYIFAYLSPVAELHWYVLATQIRCHVVQVVLTSRDTKLLEGLILEMNQMTLPAEASPTGGTGWGAVPVCVKDLSVSDVAKDRFVCRDVSLDVLL